MGKILRTRKQFLIIILSFALGVCLYIYAAFSTFAPIEYGHSGIDPYAMIILTSVTGLVVLALGYGSVVILGGMISLKLAEFIARLTRSRYVIEVIDDETPTIRHTLDGEIFPFCVPALVFILSVALAWDVHNLHDPRASIFHPILHALDIFAKTVSSNYILYSIDLIPAIVVLIGIAGLAPSMAFPFFRKFKITGVNTGPFHTDFLLAFTGVIVGLGALLTLVGFIYQVLWVGKGLNYYHYVLLATLGLSLHYAIGAFLGRDKSEDIVKTRLEKGSGERILLGTVTIQISRPK